MPHVSRYSLRKDIERELIETLLESIASARTKALAQELVADLLTPTEKIMLAKRILIAMLLEDGYTYFDIARVLKVTPTTINTIKTVLAKSGRGFRALHRLLQASRQAREDAAHREKRREELAETLRRVINMLRLPNPASKRDMHRWKKALGASL